MQGHQPVLGCMYGAYASRVSETYGVSRCWITQILLIVLAIVANMPFDFIQVGLYVLMLESVCSERQCFFPPIQEYEAVEFNNDDPFISKDLKAKGVRAISVRWGGQPTDFMCHGFYFLPSLLLLLWNH